MMRTLGLIALLALGACSQRTVLTGDPEAVAALRAMPPAQYAATVALAQQVANGCAVYTYNVPLGRALDAQRAALGEDLASAQRQFAAVELETDVARRSLLAIYEIEALTGPDVCAVAAGEVARSSGLGSLLSRV